MATQSQDPMENVERHRAQLEESVSKLSQALKHWRTWEFEYEMLKEELEAASSPSRSEMIEIGQNLGGTLLKPKEVEELIGTGQTDRTANQVIDMISRRVDYVQQNISSAEKQLDAAEKKLEGASVLLAKDMENEEGLPLMDILEELDEEGNVISGEATQPGQSAPEILEALRRAGIQKAELEGKQAADAKSGEPSGSAIQSTSPKETPNSAFSKPESNTASPARAKKSVKFSEDTKPDPTEKKLATLAESGYNEELADYNFTTGTKVIEVDEDDNEIASYPIIPQGESPEDAELRRQMLQYGLSEVGQVVAEIDLDGRDDDYSDEDMDDEFNEDYDSDEEVEDKFGRSLKREVTDDYKQQMLDLEKKLNARMVENIGPRPDDFPLAEYAGDIRTLKIRKDDDFPSAKEDAPADSGSKKKGVRFAEEVGVSPAPEPVKAPTPPSAPAVRSTTTISDKIVERTGPTPQPPVMAPSKPAKVSRFKSSQKPSGPPVMLPSPPVPEPTPVPTGPIDRVVAEKIIEHGTEGAEPHVPDEYDPVVMNREIQTQYHMLRNKIIQQQGGFKPTAEEEDSPLMEETEDGRTRKVSRFRAARIKADGL